ncbi:MAG TPA: Crp/Fnr family transcriptional regulator [Acidobacteriota bacterium]|nr:Crp/Fnr family transcriptional regulator [Acidobacteriota bacterium]
MKVELDFLRRVGLFAQLTDEELEQVGSYFREKRYKRNEIIFFEEDTGHYFYVVKKGRVKVSRLLPSGKEMILAFHEDGEYFGEMALVDGGTTPATVTAVVNTTIFSLGAVRFRQLLNENTKVNDALLKMLCSRCRDAWSQIEVLTFHNADSRIRTALYQLCQKKGEATANGKTRISLQLTHKELADITGISRETATRVLSHLQNEKLLSVESRHFLIADPDELVDALLLA